MQRLSGLDAAFLYLETPAMHMHVCLVAVLDPATMPEPYSFERLRDHVATRVPLIPPFHRLLREVPFRAHHPVWVEVDDLAISDHVHRVEIGPQGDEHALARLAGAIASVPLDRSRPLWDMTVVEGLDDGRLGLVVKVHHSAMDGSAGIEIMYALFDLTADAAPVGSGPASLEDLEAGDDTRDDSRDETPHDAAPVEASAPSASPGGAELLAQGLVRRLQTAAGLPALTRRTGAAISAIARHRSDDEAPAGGTPLRAPRTPFNGAIDAGRSLAFARIDLDEVKEIRAAFGVTVNDVVLTLCARALRSYLSDRGALPDEPLLASCPVSVRTEDHGGADNRVSVMFTHLHAELDDPADCLRATAGGAAGAKSDHARLGSSMLADWAELIDPRSLTLATDLLTRLRLGDHLPPVHNLVVSNLAGPPFPVFLGGAKLEQAYPMGPVLEGAALNITVLSYCGQVDVGFIAATNLVPDLDSLADAIAPAFAELVARARAEGSS